jgi:hypothetical protein
VDAKKHRLSRTLRRTKSRALRAGTGSLVLATAVLIAPPADAAKAPEATGDAALDARARAARSQLSEAPAPAHVPGDPIQLTWWGNWHNWGYHPWWHNWPNWRNWHNWRNW